MNTQSGGAGETATIWLISLIAAVFVAVLLLFFTNWILIQVVFVAGLAFVGLGILLMLLMRGAMAAPALAQAGAQPAPQAAQEAAPKHAPKAAAAAAPVSAPASAPVSAPASPAPAEPASTPDFDGDGVQEGAGEGTRPEALTAARGGKADNLKEIKGIGPKMEKMCNALGFYHFDQIAAWNDDEVAWVNANLEGFKGRVTRDQWVAQAKILAAGGDTEFSKRVEKGGVY